MKVIEPYRIMLVDDFAPVRLELKRILCGAPGCEVIGEAGDGLELLAYLSSNPLPPQLVILDLSLPNLSGIETLRRIKATYPHLKVLIVTQHVEEAFLREAISEGAEGYVIKGDAITELLPAIETIQQGNVYISSFFSRSQ